MEKWKRVLGWEKFYSVSDLGRVKSHDRMVWTTSVYGKRFKKKYRGKLLKASGRPYPLVCFSHPKKGYQIKIVHVLVIRAFKGPRPTGKETCHNDGNPMNNRNSNLRYGTKSENAFDRVRHAKAVLFSSQPKYAKLRRNLLVG